MGWFDGGLEKLDGEFLVGKNRKTMGFFLKNRDASVFDQVEFKVDELLNKKELVSTMNYDKRDGSGSSRRKQGAKRVEDAAGRILNETQVVSKPVRVEKVNELGWDGLGRSEIVFDEETGEYVYNVKEPVLTPSEKNVKDSLCRFFQIETDVDVSEMEPSEKREHLREILEKIIYEKNFRLDESSRNKIFYYVFRDFLGYGKIDVLMHDNEIEDISCDGYNIPVFIYHREFESMRTNIFFTSAEELDSYVFKLAQMCGKQLSVYEPIVDGKLPDGSRLQTTLGKTVTQHSNFTIRRFRSDPLTPVDLINNNTLSLEMAAYFWVAVESNRSMLFCGGTASGKTTMLNALSLFLPQSYKIVSVEDTREINLPHENWIAGTTRQGFSTGSKNKTQKDIDMFDLLKTALRQRPQVIIVGEVRGEEAYTLFQAMSTGHISYSTIHARDIQTLIQRLENPPMSLPRSLITSLDAVVFLKNLTSETGRTIRRVSSVVEIIKQDPQTARLITITPFTWGSLEDDVFRFKGGSRILDEYAREKNWSEEQLREELNRRKEVLDWMCRNNYRSYRDVGRIISEYRRRPKELLAKI